MQEITEKKKSSAQRSEGFMTEDVERLIATACGVRHDMVEEGIYRNMSDPSFAEQLVEVDETISILMQALEKLREASS